VTIIAKESRKCQSQRFCHAPGIAALRSYWKGDTKALTLVAIERIAKAFDDLRKEEPVLASKGSYGLGNSVFQVTSFSRLMSNALSVGRVEKRFNEELKGSCTHLGGGYFLTSSHVFSGSEPLELAVRFPQSNGDLSTNTFWFETVIDFNQVNGTAKCDVVLCKITKNIDDTKSIPRVTPCANILNGVADSIEENTALYVVGFPNIARYTLAVHDNCKTVIPHRVAAAKIEPLFFRLTLQDLTRQCANPGMELLQRSDILKTKFKDLYGHDMTKAVPTGKVFIARFDGEEIMGLDSNTFDGNSGGGVFAKETGELVAIFRGGNLSRVPVPRADAGRFEYSTPIEIFWTELIKHLPKNL